MIASSPDGGASWSNLTVPSTTPELYAVACADVNDCVAAGQGALLTTHDGGRSWTVEDPPTPKTTLLGVTCLGQTCLATGISPNPGGPYDGQILRSGDDGDTWAASTLPPHALGVGAVACPTATFCVAVGAEILVSSDGGQTWQYREVNGGTEALRSISCPSATQCVAIGANPEGQFVPSAVATAVLTTDGGETWQQDGVPSGSAALDVVDCGDASSCLAGGGRTVTGNTAAFATSSDGGATWAASSPPAGLTSVAGISCPRSGQCVVVGHDNAQPVAAYTAPGLPWQAVAVPPSVTSTTTS